jgi:hypothetical protein
MSEQEFKKIARGLAHALKAKKYDVPHSVLLHAIAAMAGETDWHVLKAHAQSPAQPTEALHGVPVIRLGEQSLSLNTLRRLSGSGDIRAIVEVELNSLLDFDLDAFLDELSERMTGSAVGLSDISYQVVHPAGSISASQDLALDVFQNLSDWKPKQLKLYGLDPLFEKADSALKAPRFIISEGAVAIEVVAAEVNWEGLNSLGHDAESTTPVPAKAYTDDRVIEVSFDAATWFQAATDVEIVQLAQCGYGGDYPADNVAIALATENEDLAELHRYLERRVDTRNECGFECHVDPAAALAWITQHRPALLGQLASSEEKN